MFGGREADGQVLSAPQQSTQHLKLQTRKVDESVDIDPVKFRKAEQFHLAGKKTERFLRCRTGTLHDRFVGIQNQRKLFQLCAQFAVQFFRKLTQRAAFSSGCPERIRLLQDQLLQVDVLCGSPEQA